ncbi:MAG: DUF3024 domain-containing protein, partial [Acidimicrobiia bacterium]|nr:DUF3024 domain-containing protein [Acidimicrobiia bacterium]
VLLTKGAHVEGIAVAMMPPPRRTALATTMASTAEPRPALVVRCPASLAIGTVRGAIWRASASRLDVTLVDWPPGRTVERDRRNLKFHRYDPSISPPNLRELLDHVVNDQSGLFRG